MSFTKVAQFPCSPATTRGQAVHLSADPKGERMVYTNGRTIIIRNLDRPSESDEYTEHTCQASVARWSPSGYYIASGDVQGNVRIWDTINAEHILKINLRPITGRISDIAWDSESKRIIAVGEGKERYGLAFSYDSGTTCGDIVGHSKVSNSAHIRPVRPFRAATCSDDLTVNFYHGPPYKFVKSLVDHQRFVQCVRFSPDGAFMVSTGSDGKVILYDGSTGDKIAELTDGAHTGGVMSASWSQDSKQIVTSSLDCTVKIWDVSAQKAVNTVVIGKGVDYQQVGNLWTQKHLLSLGLTGEFNYLDARSDKPIKTIYGHQKSITSFSLNVKDQTFYSGSYDGKMYSWDCSTGLASPITGKGHTSSVAALSSAGAKLCSVGFDDTFKIVDPAGKAFDANVSVATEGQPRCVAQTKDGNVAVVGTNKEVAVFKGGNKVSSVQFSQGASAVAVSVDDTTVAVGGDDKKVYLFSLSGSTLAAKGSPLDGNRGAITALAYSPDGKYLAAADTDRKIIVYDTANGKVALEQWCFHSAKVNCVSWSADSLHAVSGGLDRDIYVWSVQQPMKYIAIKAAHQEGVSGVAFLESDKIVSTGADGCVKVWKVVHH